MARTTFLVRFDNTNVDAGNYQLCDIDLSTGAGGSLEEQTAQVIAYFASVSGGMASGLTITSCSVRFAGGPGFVPQPFPTTEYAAVVAAGLTDGFVVPAMASGYGTGLGSGGLCPLGTSISVSETTAQPGKTGRGRHFLPFVSENTVTAGGSLSASHAAIIFDCYREFLIGLTPTGGFATAPIAFLIPVVASSLAVPGFAVTDIKAQPVFSNLESRRR